MTVGMIGRPIFLSLLALLFLAACSSNKDTAITGERIAVLKPEQALKPDAQLADQTLVLSAPVVNEAWPQAMGLPSGTLSNLAFTQKPEKAWSASIGEGSEDDARLLARPVAAEGLVYTIDSNAQVRAFRLKDGDRVWSRDLQPEDYDEAQFGGGLAYANGQLYVTTGYGSVVALNAKTGDVQWQHEYKEVLRTAPMVAGSRVFVVTADGQTHALSINDGSELWTHSGINESSMLLGNGVPVAVDDVLFVPYSSGELYAIRVQNGKTLWQQSLTSNRRAGGGMPALSDIKGSPALDSERVYAASNAGRMAAIDKRTGNALWDIDLASVDTPVIVDDTIVAVADRHTIVMIDRKSGRIRATYPLPKFEDEQNSKKPIYWSGPVIGDGVIWVVSSHGKMIGIDAVTGKQVARESLSDGTYLSPVLVEKTLLVITDDGRLTAYR